MKNLKVILQKSIWIFVLLFMAACQSDQDEALFVPESLPYESLKVYPQDSKDAPPIVSLPKSDIPAFSRYLTLFDANRENGIVIRIKSSNKALLESLNEETLELIALEKELPGGSRHEAPQPDDLSGRSSLKSLEIEVIETRLQKRIKFYGVKFINTNLIKEKGVSTFTYRHSNVSAVHVFGRNVIKHLPQVTVLTSDCPDCEAKYLAPQYIAPKQMISFIHSKRSNIILKVQVKFSDDLVILW